MGCRHPLNNTTLDSQRSSTTTDTRHRIPSPRFVVGATLKPSICADQHDPPNVIEWAQRVLASTRQRGEAHRSGKPMTDVVCGIFGHHHLLSSPWRRLSWAQSDHLSNAERSAIFLGMGDAVDGHVADPRGMCGVSSPDESPSSHFDAGDHFYAVEFFIPAPSPSGPRGPPGP